MHVQSRCFAYQTYCSFAVLVADAGSLMPTAQPYSLKPPADVLWGWFFFVTHSFLPVGRNECVTPQDVCGEAIFAVEFEKLLVKGKSKFRVKQESSMQYIKRYKQQS